MRLAGRPLIVRGADGRELLVLGDPAALAGGRAVRHVLSVGDGVFGEVETRRAPGEADDGPAQDLAGAAAHLFGERLGAEAEKNALTSEILARLQELSVVYDVSANLAAARDIMSVGETVLSRAASVMTPAWGAFLAYEADRRQVRIVASLGSGAGVAHGWRTVEHGSLTWQALTAESVLLIPRLTDVDRVRIQREFGPAVTGATCVLAAPTAVAGQPLGTLVLFGDARRPAFNSIDAKLLGSLALQAAVSVGHVHLHDASKEMFLSTVWSLASAIDAKDPYTHGHGQRVARYAATLGRSLGFDDRDVERLELSAVLHDVGKIGVPEAILNKPDRLSPAEMAVMKTHPERGAEILSSIRAMRDVVPGVLHHHERFDGLGYPSGLRGEIIPLQARIILVADTFDAMTSSRPYRVALPLSVALAELSRCSGTQFDPRLAALFASLLERGLVRAPEGARLGSCDAFEGGEP